MIELPFYLFVVGILIWLSVVSVYLYKTVTHYNKLIRLGKEDNLSSILEKILKELGSCEKSIGGLKEEIEKIKSEGVAHIQKVGFLRYNPFTDIGGDQSFIISILDGDNNGVIITSLHGRDQTRWYAKKIVKGDGLGHQLSDEEKKVIKESQDLRNKK